VSAADPLLSAAETDALLNAMRSTGDDANVESADIGSPDRPLRQALGRADHCVQQMSPELRKSLLRIANCTSKTFLPLQLKLDLCLPIIFYTIYNTKPY
jgi:flagellar motor switch protein FliM